MPPAAEKRDWVSPEELRKEWRRKEIVRLLIVLVASHGLSFLLFFPERPPPQKMMPLVREGHILIQVLGQSWLEHFSGHKVAVSLFSESGDFLSHARLHQVRGVAEGGERQLLTLEIPSLKLTPLLKWQREGIVATPRDHSREDGPLNSKERRRIYEVDF